MKKGSRVQVLLTAGITRTGVFLGLGEAWGKADGPTKVAIVKLDRPEFIGEMAVNEMVFSPEYVRVLM